MYESPVSRICGEVHDEIFRKDEEHLISVITQKVGYQVDTEEVVKALNYDREQYNKGYKDGYEAASELVTWIPCDVRQPEESGDYWCTFGGTNITGSDYFTTELDAKETFVEPEEHIGWRSHNVIAWMPTPQPYNQESEGKQMGGKWSICARNLKDGYWKVSDYSCNFIQFIFKSIFCLIKYDVVTLGKHGR